MQPATALAVLWLTSVGAAVAVSLLIVDLAGPDAAYTAPVIGSAILWAVGAPMAIMSLSRTISTQYTPLNV